MAKYYSARKEIHKDSLPRGGQKVSPKESCILNVARSPQDLALLARRECKLTRKLGYKYT